jgi:hypothetical protein
MLDDLAYASLACVAGCGVIKSPELPPVGRTPELITDPFPVPQAPRNALFAFDVLFGKGDLVIGYRQNVSLKRNREPT